MVVSFRGLIPDKPYWICRELQTPDNWGIVDSGWALWGVPNEVFHGDGVAATEAKQKIEFHLAEASSVLQRFSGARGMWCAVQLLQNDLTVMVETRCNDSTVRTT